LAIIRERRFAAIAAAETRPAVPERDADRSPRLAFVPSAAAWAHEPGAGWLPPRAGHSVVRITWVNLVAAHDDFIRKYYFQRSKLKND
jgi:hypothetical protein